MPSPWAAFTSALHWSAVNDNAEMIRVLLYAGDSVGFVLFASAPAPESPVADAAMQGDIETVRSLLRSGADVNAAQGDGMTALHWAAVHNNVAMAELVLYAAAPGGGQ